MIVFRIFPCRRCREVDNICLIKSNCIGVNQQVIQHLRNFLSRKPKCQDWVWFIVKIAGKIRFIYIYIYNYIHRCGALSI